jgi:hypothetical protein
MEIGWEVLRSVRRERNLASLIQKGGRDEVL